MVGIQVILQRSEEKLPMKKLSIKPIVMSIILLIFWYYTAYDVCQNLQGKINMSQYLESVLFNYHKILFNNAICLLFVLLVTIQNYKREEYVVRAKERNFLIQIKQVVKYSCLYSILVLLLVFCVGASVVEFDMGTMFALLQYGIVFLEINYGFSIFCYYVSSIKNRNFAFVVEMAIILILLLAIHYYVFYFCDTITFQMHTWFFLFLLIGILCSIGLFKDLKEKEYIR